MTSKSKVEARLKESVSQGLLDRISNVLAAAISIAALVWAADAASWFGMAFYTEQFLALVLGLSLAIVFFKGTISKQSAFKRVLDIFIGVAALLAALYLCIFYADLLGRQMRMPLDGLIVSGILVVAILEGVRRTLGPVLVFVILATFGFGMFGHLVTGPLQTRYVPPDRLLLYVGLDSSGMLGITLAIAATIVIAFILFGQILLASGAGNFFNDLALSLMGRKRGGSAKIAIVGSGLFGTISGVVVSNIVATGVITIKIMIQGGYRRTTAAAIEAVASTGGQILPPIMGAVAFLMAEILQVPYSEIVYAAIVPAILFYIAIFLQTDLEAAKNRIPPIEEEMIPKLKNVIRIGWPFTLPFSAVIVALFWLNQRADTAALLGAFVGVAIGLFYGYGQDRLRLRDLWTVLVGTGLKVIDIILIAASAGYLIGVLNISGLGFGLSYTLVQIGSSNLFMLLLLAGVICIILGMGMPTVGVYLVLSVMIAPAIVEVGIDPIAAHFFIFYLGMMSMVTPPVGIAAFFAASIAETDKMKTAFEAMRFGWVAYVIPFVFVVTPALLLNDTWLQIIINVPVSICGVWLVSAAFVGWLRGDLANWERVLVGMIGLALLWPDHVYFGSWHGLDMAALATLIGFHFVNNRKNATKLIFQEKEIK